MSADAKLQAILDAQSLIMPPAAKPMGVYKPIVITGNLAYLSGHGPLQADKSLIVGRLGADLDVAAGYHAAKITGLGLLATLREALGSLDRVSKLVKLLGLVRCTDTFDAQPAVINGCSELFRDVFGEADGIGARSAVGTNALPGGIAVEIEAIFEIN
jgi:enamine deaminase RidA (YjgF/YER057c/UK114 family)